MQQARRRAAAERAALERAAAGDPVLRAQLEDEALKRAWGAMARRDVRLWCAGVGVDSIFVGFKRGQRSNLVEATKRLAKPSQRNDENQYHTTPQVPRAARIMANRRANQLPAARALAADALRVLQARAQRWVRDRGGALGAVRRLARDAQVYWRKAAREAMDTNKQLVSSFVLGLAWLGWVGWVGFVSAVRCGCGCGGVGVGVGWHPDPSWHHHHSAANNQQPKPKPSKPTGASRSRGSQEGG